MQTPLLPIAGLPILTCPEIPHVFLLGIDGTWSGGTGGSRYTSGHARGVEYGHVCAELSHHAASPAHTAAHTAPTRAVLSTHVTGAGLSTRGHGGHGGAGVGMGHQCSGDNPRGIEYAHACGELSTGAGLRGIEPACAPPRGIEYVRPPGVRRKIISTFFKNCLAKRTSDVKIRGRIVDFRRSPPPPYRGETHEGNT